MYTLRIINNETLQINVWTSFIYIGLNRLSLNAAVYANFLRVSSSGPPAKVPIQPRSSSSLIFQVTNNGHSKFAISSVNLGNSWFYKTEIIVSKQN